MTMSNEANRWDLSDIKGMLDQVSTDGHVATVLRRIVKLMEDEVLPNFILNSLIINNDVLAAAEAAEAAAEDDE